MGAGTEKISDGMGEAKASNAGVPPDGTTLHLPSEYSAYGTIG